MKEGAVVTGIIEYNSAIYDTDGIDIDDAKHYFTKNGSFDGYPNADEITTTNPQEFMEKPCDILIPSAKECALNRHNADRLNCKIIVEGANGPTTFNAETMLNKRGIIVVPDMLANGGGVTCSYFEWLKNLAHVAPGRMIKKYQEKKNIQMLETMGYNLPKNSPHMKNLKGAKEIDIVYSGLDEIMSEATIEHWDYAVE